MLIVTVQRDLMSISSGGSGSIYIVNHNVVLKAPHIYKEPEESAEFRDIKEFKFYTLKSYESIDYEREIFKRLPPHQNITHPLALEFPEGIYLERHQSLQERIQCSPPSHATRLFWYADICNGLVHLHKTGFVHGDLRLGNILCDQYDRAIICDFGSVEEIGCENHFAAVDYNGLVDLNGVSDRLNAATDLFAFASLVFEIEIGRIPQITKSSSGLETPIVDTGSQNLNSLIARAWLGQYQNAEILLKDIEHLIGFDNVSDERPLSLLEQENAFKIIAHWRQLRIWQHGSVLNGLIDDKSVNDLRQSLNEMRKAQHN